ncbi:MAG: nucleoside-diphosphate kinase [Euryarchaeota archaeon]|nr:nucleoside-diphosphate kinase [Euryarchaeota archaeon]|tara:strand:- start:14831 stop:15277 length:447 start_codon:yes stop_codon:yes gene_type:complete
METTYVMIKPDGVQRGLIGEIVGRFERKGLKLVGMKSVVPSKQTAETHYAVHAERPFYPGLIQFVTSGPVVCMAWSGKDAISVARTLIGATNGREANPGTIRGDFGMDMGYNMIHGSDAADTAAFELGLWFPEGLMDWEQTITSWVYE